MQIRGSTAQKTIVAARPAPFGTRDCVTKNGAYLNLKRDPSLIKSDLFDLLFPGVRRRKNA